MSKNIDLHQISTSDLLTIDPTGPSDPFNPNNQTTNNMNNPNNSSNNQTQSKLRNFHTTIPKVDWHDEKRQAIKQLTQDLLEATQIPTLEQTIQNLILMNLPTRKLFYDFGSLLDKKFLSQLYPEFFSIKPGRPIPDEIGPYKLDPHYLFLNERHYIIPILERVGDEGYDIAKVTNGGIYFIIKEEDLPESILPNYQRFFMSNEKVLYEIEQVIQTLLKNNHQRARSFTDIYRLRINGDQFNHIRITYPDSLTRHEINQMRLELSAHYKRMGYQIKFFYDRNLEDQTLPGSTQPEPTVLKIFFNLQDVVPQIRDRMNNRKSIKKPQSNTNNHTNNHIPERTKRQKLRPIPVEGGFSSTSYPVGFQIPNGLTQKKIPQSPPQPHHHDLDLDSNDFLLEE